MKITYGLKHKVPNAGLPFRDDFDRPNGGLCNNWTDAADVEGTDAYAHLGILDGWVTTPSPSEGDTTVISGVSGQAIGCAYRDFGVRDVSVTVLWGGDAAFPGLHLHEAAPLLHIVPGTDYFGYGVWTSAVFPNQTGDPGIYWVGWIGNPASTFNINAYGFYNRDDQPHEITMTSINGQARVYNDGVEVDLLAVGSGAPLEYATVPTVLAQSTMHGFGIDNHLDQTVGIKNMGWISIDRA